jgi:transposase, IS5 family
MRRLYHDQLPLGASDGQHPRSAELAEMSRLLDAMETPLRAIRHDLVGSHSVSVKKGREGLSSDQVLRIGLVKQMFDLSYDGLAFHLEDSLQLRAFCRLSPSMSPPKRSTLQANIGAIRAKTWQAVDEAIVFEARRRKVEDGRWMRTDATVVESNIHHPLDSALLYDGVRVLTRILQRAKEDFGTTFNHVRRAKRRSIAILHAGHDMRSERTSSAYDYKRNGYESAHRNIELTRLKGSKRDERVGHMRRTSRVSMTSWLLSRTSLTTS